MTIICLVGKKRVGKDTVANILCKRHGFRRIALADPLKDICSRSLGISKDYFNDDNLKDKPFDYVLTIDYEHLDKMRRIIEEEWGVPIPYSVREEIEEYFDTRLDTPREVMQMFGTDIIRRRVKDDIFIQLAFNRISELGSKVIITDARMSNEREAFRRCGAIIALVKRNTNDLDGHMSENDLGEESEYDLIINNNDTLQSLENELGLWYSMSYESLKHYRTFDYERE